MKLTLPESGSECRALEGCVNKSRLWLGAEGNSKRDECRRWGRRVIGFYGVPNKLFLVALDEGRWWDKRLVRKLLTKASDDGALHCLILIAVTRLLSKKSTSIRFLQYLQLNKFDIGMPLIF